MNQPGLRKRISYWFDNRMARGSLTLIHLLLSITLILLLFLSIAVYFSARTEVSFFEAFFDTMGTLINAWMPSSGDSSSFGYLFFMSLAAIAGLMVTSVLIGIFSSAIEEKIYSLRKGNSIVLENDHHIILGFYPGEYTLINQLILAASGRPCTIVIAGALERDEMENYIRENIELPSNVRIICRTVDIFDPASLEKLSLEDARTIIISPTTDMNTVKSLLAVSTIINNTDSQVRINAIISKDEYRFPPTAAIKHNVTTLQTNSVIAKIIAHSCTQSGLSDTFREVFNFEGSELYNITVPGAQGCSFRELSYMLDGASPAGITHNGEIQLNPDPDTIIGDNDQILVFSENRDSARINPSAEAPVFDRSAIKEAIPEEQQSVVIIGSNSTLKTILRELPDNVSSAVLADIGTYSRNTIEREAALRNISVSYFEEDLSEEENLLALARKAEHVILLCDHHEDEDASDMKMVFYLLHLRDIRTRYQLTFNITAEMRKEHNQKLIVTDDHTDYIVASNMSSLFLAQLAESPELIVVFKELLSNAGNELYLKKAKNLHCAGQHTVSELRAMMLEQHYIFLGYRNAIDHTNAFNPPLNNTVELSAEDSLIVLGEN